MDEENIGDWEEVGVECEELDNIRVELRVAIAVGVISVCVDDCTDEKDKPVVGFTEGGSVVVNESVEVNVDCEVVDNVGIDRGIVVAVAVIWVCVGSCVVEGATEVADCAGVGSVVFGESVDCEVVDNIWVELGGVVGADVIWFCVEECFIEEEIPVVDGTELGFVVIGKCVELVTDFEVLGKSEYCSELDVIAWFCVDV